MAQRLPRRRNPPHTGGDRNPARLFEKQKSDPRPMLGHGPRGKRIPLRSLSEGRKRRNAPDSGLRRYLADNRRSGPRDHLCASRAGHSHGQGHLAHPVIRAGGIRETLQSPGDRAGLVKSAADTHTEHQAETNGLPQLSAESDFPPGNTRRTRTSASGVRGPGPSVRLQRTSESGNQLHAGQGGTTQ